MHAGVIENKVWCYLKFTHQFWVFFLLNKPVNVSKITYIIIICTCNLSLMQLTFSPLHSYTGCTVLVIRKLQSYVSLCYTQGRVPQQQLPQWSVTTVVNYYSGQLLQWWNQLFQEARDKLKICHSSASNKTFGLQKRGTFSRVH